MTQLEERIQVRNRSGLGGWRSAYGVRLGRADIGTVYRGSDELWHPVTHLGRPAGTCFSTRREAVVWLIEEQA